MFKDFDAAVFEQPEFKEDAVREEIVAPILRRLGYRPHGTTRVIRSKTLTHPFIRVGTRPHGVTTVPDYTLYHEDKAVLVLDANEITATTLTTWDRIFSPNLVAIPHERSFTIAEAVALRAFLL